jgi:hypothetical protein
MSVVIVYASARFMCIYSTNHISFINADAFMDNFLIFTSAQEMLC